MLWIKLWSNIIILSGIVVFAVLIMSVVDKSTLKLARMYFSLSNKPSRSDEQFNIPTGRIHLNADGTKEISFEIAAGMEGVETEVEEEDFEGAIPEDDTQKPGVDNDEEDNTTQTGNKLVCIVGDSISTFDGTMPSGYANFYPSGDVADIGDMWWNIYIKSIGGELGVNGSWSGSCTSGSDSSAGQSDMRIEDLGSKGEPSIILVYLGTNDLWEGKTQDEFGSAYENMLSKLKSKYSSAKIICLGLTQLSSDPNMGTVSLMDSGNGNSKDFSSIIKSKASTAGCTYVSLNDCWDYTDASKYCIDGMVHPNKEGMKKIAAKIPK